MLRKDSWAMAAVWSKAGASLGHVTAMRTPCPGAELLDRADLGTCPGQQGPRAAECACTDVTSRSPVGTDPVLVNRIHYSWADRAQTPRTDASLPGMLAFPHSLGKRADEQPHGENVNTGAGERRTDGRRQPRDPLLGTRGLPRPQGGLLGRRCCFRGQAEGECCRRSGKLWNRNKGW